MYRFEITNIKDIVIHTLKQDTDIDIHLMDGSHLRVELTKSDAEYLEEELRTSLGRV